METESCPQSGVEPESEALSVSGAAWLGHLLVRAAKWLSPHRMRETWTSGLNSVKPKRVGGTISGRAVSTRFGPFPRIP